MPEFAKAKPQSERRNTIHHLYNRPRLTTGLVRDEKALFVDGLSRTRLVTVFPQTSSATTAPIVPKFHEPKTYCCVMLTANETDLETDKGVTPIDSTECFLNQLGWEAAKNRATSQKMVFFKD